MNDTGFKGSMRKIILYFFVLSLISVLTTCASPSRPVPEVELRISIDLATPEFLATFDYIHEFDYMLVREARQTGGEDIIGDRLVIWTNTPLRNFALISIANDVINEEIIFIPMDTFDLVNELSPGMAFVINSFIGVGTLPWSGIAFQGEDDDLKRFFLLVQDQSDHFEAYRLIEFRDRRDELPAGWRPWG